MRKVGQRVIAQNACNVYSYTAGAATTTSPQVGTDGEGGFNPAYPSVPSQSSIPCNIQFAGDGEMLDEIGRVGEFRQYYLIFRFDPGVKVRDKITFTDSSLNTRTCYVQASKDMGLANACFRVTATERL